MRTPLIIVVTMCAAMLLEALGSVPFAWAAGQAPDSKLCRDTGNLPRDTITQGGCIAIARGKGNCQACHLIAGIVSGNVAPPLSGIAQRLPNKSKVRAQIHNPAKFNSKTIMPPYGRHEILTPEEIEKVVEWLWTL